jgi:hypothetical protein
VVAAAPTLAAAVEAYELAVVVAAASAWAECPAEEQTFAYPL